METKRTECVFFHCTPEIKAELERYDDDDKMKEEIIRQYIEREKSWMEESLGDLEKSELIYRCSLVKIKDDFKKAQNAYSDEIVKLYEEASNQVATLKQKLEGPKKMLEDMQEELSSFKKSLSDLPNIYTLDGIKGIFNIIRQYNSMPKEDKELLFKIINNK